MKQADYHKLLATEWADQFDEWQIKEIEAGLKAGVDVSVYAKQEFDRYQMAENPSGAK